MQATGTRAKAAMVVGALGVIFGDIGTSPIYTIQTVFNPDDPHPVQSWIANARFTSARRSSSEGGF
jgi:K+ transporter